MQSNLASKQLNYESPSPQEGLTTPQINITQGEKHRQSPGFNPPSFPFPLPWGDWGYRRSCPAMHPSPEVGWGRVAHLGIGLS